MSASDFVTRFGGIYEHSSWVAERAEPHLQEAPVAGDIARVMADCVDNAAAERASPLAQGSSFID